MNVNPSDFISKLKLPFRKERELYRSLYQILGFYPKNIGLYKQALMHKSAYSGRFRGQKLNNERLEFLGDAVLDAVVGDIVYHHFQGKPEGFLTNTRSKIVQRESLNKIAVDMGINKLIKSSDTVHNAHNSNLSGNAFEALVGAVYEDRGYAYCMRFMERRILKSLVNIDKIAYKEVNFKSKFIEWCQKNRLQFDFKLVEEGKENSASPTFVTQLVVEGVECGSGKGYTKKESQQLAAKDALRMLKHQRGMEDEVFQAKSRRTAMDEQPEALVPDVPMDADPVRENRSRRASRSGSATTKRQERQRKEKVEAQKTEPVKQTAVAETGNGQKTAPQAGEKPKRRRSRRASVETSQDKVRETAKKSVPVEAKSVSEDAVPVRERMPAISRTREQIIAEAETAAVRQAEQEQ